MISNTLMEMDLQKGKFQKEDQAEPFFYELLEPLAKCMFRAYENGPEFEGEEEEDFVEELHQVLRGLYGEFLPQGSFVITQGDRVLSAHLLCLYKKIPTTTYLFTDPDFQRRGLASSLLENSCYYLQKKGFKSIQVYLNLENKGAFKLYDDFGFNERSFQQK